MSDTKLAVAAQIADISRAIAPKMEGMKLYRPSPKGTGTALKLELRLDPVLHAKGYVETVEGGLFLELAHQAGADHNGNASFGWQSALRAKLGRADVTGLLAVLRAYWAGWECLPGAKPDKPNVRGFFHKSPAGSTVIEFTRADTGGAFIKVSRSATERVSHRCSDDDLIAIERYLVLSLDHMLSVGVR